MTVPHRSQSFVVEDLRVVSARADVSSESDMHVYWGATCYAPDPSIGSLPETRLVIASLHAHGEGGWGTVSVGGLVTPTPAVPSSIDEATWRTLLTASAALETLYDFARVNLRTVAAMTDVKLKLPFKSPEPEVRFSDGSESDDAEVDQSAAAALEEHSHG